MAGKKKKKSNNKIKITLPVLILILVVVIAVAVVFGVFYVKESKALTACEAQSSMMNAEKNKASITIEVNGEADAFDVRFKSDKDEIFAVKDSSEFGKKITYDVTLAYNTEYTVYVDFKGSVFGILQIVESKRVTTIKTEPKPLGGEENGIIYDDFQVHFLELGNEYAGDSVYIKAGDTDILIDAGSRGNSATTIEAYVDQYCTDGKLEYVIATHNHQDHIAAFAGTSDAKAKNFKGETVGRTGIFYYYEVGTLIDFTYAEATLSGESKSKVLENKNQVSSSFGSTTVYGQYLKGREYLISKGTTYYTAMDLFNTNKTAFNLSENVTMDILYNYYYFNTSTDNNDHSVCTMFNYKDHHFMMTGDLEHGGEEKMAEYYDGSTPVKTLPHVDLFKAGHHGSGTSSNDCILEKITPEICCVCTCAGNTEYTADYKNVFPYQAFVDRIAKHTDRVYVTSMFNEQTLEFESMNGNIIISAGMKESLVDIGVWASNNLIKLKDTDWFNATVYVVDGKITSGKSKKDFFTAATPGAVAVTRRVWPE